MTATPCVHRFILPSSGSGRLVLVGVCSVCGAEREFSSEVAPKKRKDLSGLFGQRKAKG